MYLRKCRHLSLYISANSRLYLCGMIIANIIRNWPFLYKYLPCHRSVTPFQNNSWPKLRYFKNLIFQRHISCIVMLLFLYYYHRLNKISNKGDNNVTCYCLWYSLAIRTSFTNIHTKFHLNFELLSPEKCISSLSNSLYLSLIHI